MPKQYIYSDKWRDCEGRHGLNEGGECTPLRLLRLLRR